MPSLNWIGKKEIKNHHNNIEYRVLDCKESVGIDNSGNLIVKGDNLLGLKALLPYYAGKIKMIYIDPPYNTGATSWIYNDAVDSPTIKKWLKKTIDINDLSRSDKWLCMIYPRLKLLKQFLADNGVIFISIDDAEVSRLRMIMDSIFGQNNFMGCFIWNSKQGKLGTTDSLAVGHEYIISYAKNSSIFEFMKITTVNEKNKNERLRQWGQGDKREDRATMFYPILRDLKTSKISTITEEEFSQLLIDKTNKIFNEDYIVEIKNKYEALGYEVIYPIKDNGEFGRWRVGLETAKELMNKNLLIAEDSNKGAREIYRIKQAGDISETAIDSVLPSFTGKTANGSTLLKQIFEGKEVFDYPKPITLIQYLMKISLVSKEDYIMDSFAGSGTTGHAVLDLNAKDNGNRKFILLEMEDYAKTVTKERIRKVIEGYSYKGKLKTSLIEPVKLTAAKLLNEKFMGKLLSEISEFIKQTEDRGLKVEKTLKDNTLSIDSVEEVTTKVKGLGGGFQYCELSEPLLNDFGLLSEHVTFEMLAKHIFFTEFGVALEKQSMNKEDNYVGEANETKLYIFMNKEFNIQEFQKIIKEEAKEYIVYVDTWSISADLLNKHNITIKRIPFEIKGA